MPYEIIVTKDLFPAIADRMEGVGQILSKLFIDKAYNVSQDLVPVDLGRLIASGHIEEIQEGWRLVYDAGNDWSGDPYGRYVEYGTRFMAAQPFITPAFEEALGYIMSEAPRVFEDLLR